MLSIDLDGKRAFVAGVADDRGYGWAIVRALAAAGAKISVGTWPPALRIVEMSLERGKLERTLPGGGELDFEGRLMVGEALIRRSEIVAVDAKEGAGPDASDGAAPPQGAESGDDGEGS